MAIKLKQIDLPPGATTTAVLDGELIVSTDAAELIAGMDPAGNAQFIATEVDGKVQVSDGGIALQVETEQLPSALVGGRLNANLGSWLGSTTPTIGQKPMTGSLPVALASDQTTLTVQGDPAGTPVRVSIPSISDANNSSTTPLAANATFTGTATNIRDFAAVVTSAFSDKASATDGLKFEWSQDGVNWDDTLAFTVPAGETGAYSVGPRANYFRVVYANSGSAQTVFRLQTTLSYTEVRTGTIRISDTVDGEADGVLVKSVVTGRSSTGGGTYVDVKCTPSGALVVESSLTGNVPLPTGAATEATLATRLAESTFTTRVPTLGQKTSAGSIPVVLASDQTAIPVTIALGKAEDSAAVSGDIGIPMLAVYQPDSAGVSAGTVGDYATLNVDDKGRLRVAPGAQTVLENFEAITGFTGIDTDATNIVLTTNHVRGAAAISFDKVDSAANNVLGLIQKTIPTIDLSNMALGVTFVQLLMFLPTLTNVKNTIIRLGTDASNYNSWSLPIGNAVAGIWQVYRAAIGTSNASVGTGWNLAAISYIAVGVEMNLQNNTLPGIVVDGLVIVAGQVNSSDINTEITSVVNTAKVDLSKIAGTATDSNTGTASNGTLRVVNATNDPNLSAISAAQTSGLQKSIARGGAKGSTTAADVTSTASGANRQPLDVAIYDAAGNQVTSFGATGSPTGTLSNVAASVTSVTLLAANTARKGATIVNDSSSALYVKFGTAASNSSFTILMAANASYYEVPFAYTGVLTGIWVTAAGNARVTEIT